MRSLCTARKDGVFDAAAAHEARKKTVLLKARWKERVCLSQVPFWWVAHPSTHSCFKNKNLLWYFVAKHYFLSANMPCNWKAGLWLLQMHSHIGCASVKFCLGLGLSECKGYMWYYIYIIYSTLQAFVYRQGLLQYCSTVCPTNPLIPDCLCGCVCKSCWLWSN